MKMKVIAGFAFLLNTILFATYYAVAKEALGRIDPIVFTFFEMTALAPVALCILALTWQHMTWPLVKRGMLLGSSLCLALFTIAIALKYSTATGTAFFPALNGFLAALIAWLVLRQPMNKATWFAGILSVAGAGLLIANSEMGGIRGATIAFLGGLFFTGYVFLSDHKPKEEREEHAHWPLFGVELITMAVWACLIVLLFGDWQAFHPSLPKDALVILYIAGACTFLPTLIAVLMQKHVSAVTVSFIYILEPVLGAIVASFYLHEVLPLNGYIGGALVVVGAFIHTWGSAADAERPAQKALPARRAFARQQFATSLFGSFLYPALCSCAGFFILYGLGGFPPSAWRELYQLVPPLMHALQQGHGSATTPLLSSLQQGTGTQSDSLLSLIVQAFCWLIAWISFAVIVYITLSRAWIQTSPAQFAQEQGLRLQYAGQSLIGTRFIASANSLPYKQIPSQSSRTELYRNELTDAINQVPTLDQRPPDLVTAPTGVSGNIVNHGNRVWEEPLNRSSLQTNTFYKYYDIEDIPTRGDPTNVEDTIDIDNPNGAVWEEPLDRLTPDPNTHNATHIRTDGGGGPIWGEPHSGQLAKNFSAGDTRETRETTDTSDIARSRRGGGGGEMGEGTLAVAQFAQEHVSHSRRGGGGGEMGEGTLAVAQFAENHELKLQPRQQLARVELVEYVE